MALCPWSFLGLYAAEVLVINLKWRFEKENIMQVIMNGVFKCHATLIVRVL
jgi:hypothetical protein